MVATRPWVALSIMTPGMNGMLRARRKDKDIRPNRFLDKTASRGMLYENEGLRLRTINISADLEKGQQYIKKLRRENSQLRREIWSLRDQYDKLETMIRGQDPEQVIGDEGNRYNCDCGVEVEEWGVLSSVPEENEIEVADASSELRRSKKSQTEPNSQLRADKIGDVTKQFENMNPSTAVIPVQKDVTQLNVSDEDDTANGEESKMCSVKTCEDIVDVFRKNADELKNYIFSVDGIEELTAQEVIDNLEQQLKNDCTVIIDGVRFTNRHCFLKVKDIENFKKLTETGFNLREKLIQIDDVWDRSSILQLSAVPHHIVDEQIVATISRFADVVGNVERQIYKGLDTGERFVHVITPEIIPCQLLLGSICLPVTIIHPRRKKSSISRRKSFRSQISINLKSPDRGTETYENSSKISDLPPDTPRDSSGGSNASRVEPSSCSKSTGVILNPAEVETNVFQFPNQTKNTESKKNQGSPPQQRSATNKATNESPSVFRRFAQRSVNSFRRHNMNCENSRPPSPAIFPTTPRIFRRSSVNFRNGSGESFGRPRPVDFYSNEFGPGYTRERSASDASSRISICRRKLSVTGHENSTKIPWCGCWGIGCC